MILWMLPLVLAADPVTDYDRTIKPIVTQHCAKCHSGEKAKSGLVLMSADKVLAGSKAGPVVIPGNVDGSLMVQVLAAGHDTHMPPDKQLDEKEITAIKEWVKGLPVTAVAKRKEMDVTDKDREHWAFRPVKPVPPPSGGHPIDAFLTAKLKAANLELAPPAEPRILIRRLTYDLTGLPPTPDEVEAFVKSAAENRQSAIDKAVDRLLASQAYGERWARHWLDLARYGDADADNQRPDPNGMANTAGAHFYRDYVIRSLNADKPYNRFLTEQIAGDLLPDADRDTRIATAFLRLSPPSGAEGPKARADELDDMVATTTSVAVGLTVACARCHDHKTDPIPQRDYYRLVAVFAGTNRQAAALPTDDEKAAVEALANSRKDDLAKLQAQLEEAETMDRDQRDDFDSPGADFVGPPTMSAWWKAKLKDQETIRRKIQELQGEQSRAANAAIVSEAGETPKSFLLLRGDPRSPGDEVQPGVPRVLSKADASLAADQRRLALAKWLTDADHPLTARVLVNRVWHYHFGRGLVDTPSNFGPAGAKPTHPEMLDWLAAEFVRSGWSLKKLHKLIVTAQAYQQTSVTSPLAKERDPDNRLMSRAPRRRLEAEAIRDALLFTSGRLSQVMYGPARARPGDNNLAPEAARSPLAVREGPQQWRRSVYLAVTRSAPSVLLESFDQPAPACPCDARSTTTVPTQSLLLLNAPLLLEQAEFLARRVKKEAGNDPKTQIDKLYQITLSRSPKSAEVDKALKFLADPAIKLRPGRRPTADDPGALADLAHVIYNLNEFVWLD